MQVTKPKLESLINQATTCGNWQRLTKEQQSVIQKHIHYQQTSLFMNHELLVMDGTGP